MDKLKPLKRKKVKEILNNIKEIYSIKDLKLDYIFYENSKGRIFILSNKFKEFEYEKLNINSLGLYFANYSKGLRLSIEGSQIIGEKAKKGVVEVNDEDLREWLLGDDIPYVGEEKGFVLIKNKKDFFGTGRVGSGKIWNFVPKERRFNVI
jgi:NOL1/NOP2/fmu family ribosome biogenesis protein